MGKNIDSKQELILDEINQILRVVFFPPELRIDITSPSTKKYLSVKHTMGNYSTSGDSLNINIFGNILFFFFFCEYFKPPFTVRDECLSMLSK